MVSVNHARLRICLSNFRNVLFIDISIVCVVIRMFIHLNDMCYPIVLFYIICISCLHNRAVTRQNSRKRKGYMYHLNIYTVGTWGSAQLHFEHGIFQCICAIMTGRNSLIILRIHTEQERKGKFIINGLLSSSYLDNNNT